MSDDKVISLDEWRLFNLDVRFLLDRQFDKRSLTDEERQRLEEISKRVDAYNAKIEAEREGDRPDS